MESTNNNFRSISRDTTRWTDEDIRMGKMAFLNTAKHLVPGFTVDKLNKDVINDLFYYFLGLKGGRLDPEKGLWIEGPIGTGKSSLMLVFSHFLRRFWNDKTFKVYNCTTIANEYTNKDRDNSNAVADALDRYTYNRSGRIPNLRVPMCFDELGREPIPAVSFGQRLNVMEYILHIRYTYWQTERLLTYVTTNINAVMTESLYGDYIRDRRKEMFNTVTLGGESRRK